MYYQKPAYGFITSLFSNARKNPVLGIIRPHQGIDISSHSDNRIFAAASGRVRLRGNTKTAGNYVIISHPNGEETNYSHMSRIDVGPKQTVTQGQVIGMKGNTGNSTGVHLHFEISKGRWSSSYSNKKDPLLHFFDSQTLEIQKLLNLHGYGPLVEDGIYGNAMIGAVTKFQLDNKLDPDGVAGRGTYALLNTPVKVATTEVPKSKGVRLLNLNKRQFEDLEAIYRTAREKGVFKSTEHEKDVRDGKMTVDKAIYLNALIALHALNTKG